VAVSAFVVATGLTMRLFLCPADDSFQAFADVATLAERAFEESLDVDWIISNVLVDGYTFRLFELES
jgi:hypothetical protein